ncbi:MAG TPA: hypothetical protein VMT85_03820 [Thermoanaerobaculia bacterium]|nr:hypothetical protein [Thermoanaerobaculia bacterium]
MNEHRNRRPRLRRFLGLGPLSSPHLDAAVEEVVCELRRLATAVCSPAKDPGRARAEGLAGATAAALVRRLLHAHLASAPARDLSFSLSLAWSSPQIERLAALAEGLCRDGTTNDDTKTPGPPVEGAEVLSGLLAGLADALAHDDAASARSVEDRANELRAFVLADRQRIAASSAAPDGATAATLQASRVAEACAAITRIASVQGRTLLAPDDSRPTRRDRMLLPGIVSKR